MKTKRNSTVLTLALVLASFAALLPTTRGQGTAFTYQGRLNANGVPASGRYDLRFKLFADPQGNTQTGSAVVSNSVPVTNGLFAVTLDFGSVFNGSNYWLEVDVKTNLAGAYVNLNPLQPITPTPYAIFAENVVNGAGLAAGTYTNAVNLNNPGNAFVGSFSGNGGGLSNVNASTVGGLTANQFWQTSGNGGTTAGVNFLGTVDNQPLEFKVNSQRALRLEPNPNGAANVIVGSPLSAIASGNLGATISGGMSNNIGSSATASTISGGASNTITTNALFATVGGGTLNKAAWNYATVNGGYQNFASGNFNGGDSATVGGGFQNAAIGNNAVVSGGALNLAEGDNSAIGGGWYNTNRASESVLGGGRLNTIQAAAIDSVIGGGIGNTVQNSSLHGLIGGGYYNTLQGGTHESAIVGGATQIIASNIYNGFIGGGWNNSIAANYATIAGGQGNVNNGDSAVITGGSGNKNTGQFGTISGGTANTNTAYAAVIAGGQSNYNSAFVGTIGGGQGNYNRDPFGTIGGGVGNRSSGYAATVGGGSYNIADISYDTVSGGQSNFAGGFFSAVGGGRNNTNASTTDSTTIAGGAGNSTAGNYAAIGGGSSNSASGDNAMVGGGLQNVSSGRYACIPGGYQNIAFGTCSFAAGLGAQSLHAASFVWSDNGGVPFASTAPNQFAVRASGGLLFAGDVSLSGGAAYHNLSLSGGNAVGYLYGAYNPLGDGIHLGYNYYYDANGGGHPSNTGGGTSRITVGYNDIVLALGAPNNPPTTVRLDATMTGICVYGTFNNCSDRNVKQNFAPVSPSQILEKVLRLPLTEWSYKEDSATRHIGPVAQDFYSAFNIGTDDKHIAPIDEGGVALAAIQGLNDKLEQKETEITELKNRLEALEKIVRSVKVN